MVRPLRRVSSAVERGILLRAGTILGMGEDGQEIAEASDLVVLDLIRRRDGWLVRYMTLADPHVVSAR